MAKFYWLFEHYFFLLLIFLSIFIPLYPKFPLVNIGGTYVAIRIEDLLILIVSFIWLLGYAHKIKEYLNQTVFQAILLFWFIGGLSVFSRIFIDQTTVAHHG